MMDYQLDRPIFIVGHARGGTTMLAGIINWHSQVGPKHNCMSEFKSVNHFLEGILNKDIHINYSEALEQKNIWFNYFPGKDTFTHMGKEMIVENITFSKQQIERLISQLTSDFNGERFLSKAPSNSFRVKIIPQLFATAKIVALYRSGPEVVSSWGQRSYGFRKKFDLAWWRSKQLGYKEGIRLFAKKWYETLEYLELTRKELGFLAIRYDDLVGNTSAVLKRIFEYLELPFENYIDTVRLEDRQHEWKHKIPKRYHRYLLQKTEKGQRILEGFRS